MAKPIARVVRAVTKIEANEQAATLLSFAFVFILMTAYFILRPVRDALSSDWTDAQLSWLWTSTFFFSLVAVSVYGAIISRVRFRIIVPGVYAFFAATFIGFYVVGSTLGENDYVNRAYYVWLSVFSLYHLSVFWTFMSGALQQGPGQAPVQHHCDGGQCRRHRRSVGPHVLRRQYRHLEPAPDRCSAVAASDTDHFQAGVVTQQPSR